MKGTLPNRQRYLWRISNHPDLKGIGGLRTSARWHTKGRPIVYCAETPTGALLEALVHLEIDSIDALPKSFQLLRIALPDHLPQEEVLLASLPQGWRETPLLTRSMGDAWLAAARTAALRIPSAVSPHAFNVLLNPRLLRGTGIRVTSRTRYPFDQRLFKVVERTDSSRTRRRRAAQR
jgi:RES domain-containing protein